MKNFMLAHENNKNYKNLTSKLEEKPATNLRPETDKNTLMHPIMFVIH